MDHKNTLAEDDTKIKGGKWDFYVFDLKRKDANGKDKRIHVGSVLLEGAGSGMNRVGTFDEMLGCTSCGQVQHTDTRYGPIVTAEKKRNGRHPIKIQGKTQKSGTTCSNRYSITGDEKSESVQFSSGPFTTQEFTHNPNNRGVGYSMVYGPDYTGSKKRGSIEMIKKGRPKV